MFRKHCHNYLILNSKYRKKEPRLQSKKLEGRVGMQNYTLAAALTVCWRGGALQRVGRCWSNFWSQASWSGAAVSCWSPLWGLGPRGLLWAAALWCVWKMPHACLCREDAGHWGGSLLREIKMVHNFKGWHTTDCFASTDELFHFYGSSLIA